MIISGFLLFIESIIYYNKEINYYKFDCFNLTKICVLCNSSYSCIFTTTNNICNNSFYNLTFVNDEIILQYETSLLQEKYILYNFYQLLYDKNYIIINNYDLFTKCLVNKICIIIPSCIFGISSICFIVISIILHKKENNINKIHNV